ncbi:MAG: hypothetical protein ACI9KE_005686 [Polyangiales bacterium]
MDEPAGDGGGHRLCEWHWRVPAQCGFASWGQRRRAHSSSREPPRRVASGEPLSAPLEVVAALNELGLHESEIVPVPGSRRSRKYAGFWHSARSSRYGCRMPRALGVLGRTLLRVARARAHGWMLVQSQSQSTRLLFESGVLCAYEDRRSSTRSMEHSVGETSLSQRRYLVRRLASFAAGSEITARFLSTPYQGQRADMLEAMPAIDLVVAMARQLPLGGQAGRVLSSPWRLGALGEELESAPLSSHEAALYGVLKRLPGSRGEEIVPLAGGHPALKTLVAWRDLGLVRSRGRSGSHADLLRTKQALARGSALATGKQRRRLAASFHPDRFDDELCASSRRVMQALLNER